MPPGRRLQFLCHESCLPTGRALAKHPQRAALFALFAQCASDAADFGFSAGQRFVAGVDGVTAKAELVRVLRCRSQHETGVSLGDEVNRRLCLLENRELSLRDERRRSQRAVHQRDPCNVGLAVARTSSAHRLSGSPTDRSVWCDDGACGVSVASDDDTRGSVRRNLIGQDVLALTVRVFELGRECHPELEASDDAGIGLPVCQTPPPARIHSMLPAGKTPDWPVVSA